MPAHPDAVANPADRSDTATRLHRGNAVKGGLPGYRLRRAVEYIAAHVSEELTLERLSYVVGMSPHYFASMFRRSTGAPPHQFVLLHRIERAKEHLGNSRCSILDVALDVGFNNPSHFARTFRRFVGISPSAFRTHQLVVRREDAGSDAIDAGRQGNQTRVYLDKEPT